MLYNKLGRECERWKKQRDSERHEDNVGKRNWKRKKKEARARTGRGRRYLTHSEYLFSQMNRGLPQRQIKSYSMKNASPRHKIKAAACKRTLTCPRGCRSEASGLGAESRGSGGAWGWPGRQRRSSLLSLLG